MFWAQTMWHLFYIVVAWVGLSKVYLQFVALLFTFYIVIRQCFAVSIVKERLLRKLRKRNDCLPAIVKRKRDQYWQEFTLLCGGLLGIVLLIKLYRGFRKVQDPQGALEPTTVQEIEERSKETNPWQSVQRVAMPGSDKSRTMTVDRLDTVVRKNLRYGKIIREGKPNMIVNGLFLRSNIVVIPNHYFADDEEFEVVFTYEKPGANGHEFRTRLSTASSVLIDGTDLRLCYSPTGGSFKDIVEYFPEFDEEIRPIPNHPFRMLYRDAKGEVTSMHGTATMGLQDNSIRRFYGGICRNLTHNTFKGLCGSPVIAETKPPTITGIHLGGLAGKPISNFGSVSKQVLLDTIEELRELGGVLLTGQAGEFPEQQFGVKLMTSEDLNPKSPLNYLPTDHTSQIQYFGSCKGAATFRSDVKPTIMSKDVEEVTGVPNTWGPPKMKPDWFGWQTCMANLSSPGKSFPVKLLQKAIEDFKQPLVDLVRRTRYWRDVTPLSEHETLNGIPGVKFMDAVKLNTSIGYPLGGTKRKHVVENPPTEEHPVNRTYAPAVQKEIDEAYARWSRGERAYLIAKGCKKDEILPSTKEKCRIFYGNPIALTHGIRKYFLPIIRFIQMNPLLSEQAVGINAHSPEWDELSQHIEKFGKERTIAGDYSKYDQRMPSQCIEAALRVLIDIAKEMTYTNEDIRTMEAMCGDIVFAYIAFNGDLIGLTEGTHISGNSLTVLINGIVGSLNMRMAYYSIYPWTDDFRAAVALMCYGDDNIGSVREDRTDFNIDAAATFLAEYGQKLTMPDKESDITKFATGADFLCRTSSMCPKRGKRVGALADASIFKSLHNYRRPKGSELTEQQACAQNIDSALNEWFLHGEKVYNERVAQMREIAKRNNLDHISEGIHKTYDERIAKWHQDYTLGEQGSAEVPAVDIEDLDRVPGAPTVLVNRSQIPSMSSMVVKEVKNYAVRRVVKTVADAAIAGVASAATDAALKSGLALAFI
jgi:hypothetical protein